LLATVWVALLQRVPLSPSLRLDSGQLDNDVDALTEVTGHFWTAFESGAGAVLVEVVEEEGLTELDDGLIEPDEGLAELGIGG